MVDEFGIALIAIIVNNEIEIDFCKAENVDRYLVEEGQKLFDLPIYDLDCEKLLLSEICEILDKEVGLESGFQFLAEIALQGINKGLEADESHLSELTMDLHMFKKITSTWHGFDFASSILLEKFHSHELLDVLNMVLMRSYKITKEYCKTAEAEEERVDNLAQSLIESVSS